MNAPPVPDSDQLAATPSPSPETGSPGTEDRAARQKAVLLYQLADAPDQKLGAGEANRKLSQAARKTLHLTNAVANRLRQELVQEGLLETTRQGRKVVYGLTERGREHVRTLERPLLPGRAGEKPVDESSMSDELRGFQRAYLLLQLFLAEGWTLTRKEANDRLTRTVQQKLGLTKTLANRRRTTLAEQGYVRVTRVGRTEQYELTDDGLDYLSATEQPPSFEFRIRGEHLNALLEAARASAAEAGSTRAEWAGPTGAGAAGPDRPEAQEVPTERSPEQLREAVLAEFEELRRETYSRTGLVPIHAVRARIAEKYGERAAEHDVLDEQIRELWREGRLGVVPLSDPQSASGQQLDSSLPGTGNEMFFYLEAAQEEMVGG
jgi:predicted transcriptional regulator